jgi:hypothetical protein
MQRLTDISEDIHDQPLPTCALADYTRKHSAHAGTICNNLWFPDRPGAKPAALHNSGQLTAADRQGPMNR